MKRGGMAIALVLAISGFLRVAGPEISASPRETGQGRVLSGAAPVPETPKGEPKDAYLKDLEAQIQGSYGVWEGNNLASHLNVPDHYDGLPQREKLRFVIATLPDPAHTHLALAFDRGVEAIQQAAQGRGYFFERAIMPWARTSPTEFADFGSRQLETEERKNREEYPGLLIFRQGPQLRSPHAKGSSEKSQVSPPGANYGIPLFVLVVGETPTGGVNKTQFRNALQIIKRIRETGDPEHPAQKVPALILGPTFSGSFVSLSQVLRDPETKNAFSEAIVYSGTVTDKDSEDSFKDSLKEQWGSQGCFVSFQENDGYLLAQFLAYARKQEFENAEMAVLSESDTVYGKHPGVRERTSGSSAERNPCPGQTTEPTTATRSSDSPRVDIDMDGLVFLQFPREISYFRSAYQKELQTQPQAGAAASGKSALTLDLGLAGSNDDIVAPYAATVTPASQEAVMLGIVSELHKHQIIFTVVFATDPIDELFLARYLRSAYPKGRVVVTSPDLLFTRQEDTLLHGVLGLNTYPLVAGLDDQLCRSEDSSEFHEDRLLVSSMSVGTFNAMTGLLSVTQKPNMDNGPSSEFEEYKAPFPNVAIGAQSCSPQPVVWLTMLGRDGFWPITGFEPAGFQVAIKNKGGKNIETNLKPSEEFEFSPSKNSDPPANNSSCYIAAHTPAAWSLTYCFCVFLMLSHVVLSFTGSLLADSESRSQFARTEDRQQTFILAIGAWCLGAAFVVLMCARSPAVSWDVCSSWFLNEALWLPFFLFVAAAICDLGWLRHQKSIAAVFSAVLGITTTFVLLAALGVFPKPFLHWPTRIVALASGASPVLPALLLLAGGYWWMWQSLRGVTLVDLRRPRLPDKADLPPESYHIDDDLGEQLRGIAHPFPFSWKVLLPVAAVLVAAGVFMDFDHPVQTVEGVAFDITYGLLLGLIVAQLLFVLLKLVGAWFKCRQVLAGLDRLPLREAFRRMSGLSWQSIWSPSGSTLRETFKVTSRTLESLGHLDLLLKKDDPAAPCTADDRTVVRKEIQETFRLRAEVHRIYEEIARGEKSWFWLIAQDSHERDTTGAISRFLRSRGRRMREAKLIPSLMEAVEKLQKQMAKTAGTVMKYVLKPWWKQDFSPVVSDYKQNAQKDPSVCRILAEEFTALVYVNFLITVLLRMRTLVICAAGLYVFMVLSVNVYPFEPHTALQTLCVMLLVFSGAVVGFVYAGMHRDAVLSRLTSKGSGTGEGGELGWDFWLKFASAGAIPLFSLLASQFPSISQFLFSWLEPALQALK